MFNPHLEPKDLTDEQLESKIKDVTLRINQASRMNNTNLYQQLLAINNTLQLAVSYTHLTLPTSDLV